MNTIREKKAKSKKKRAVKIVSIILAILIALIAVLSVFFYNFVFVINSPIHMTKLIDMGDPVDEGLTYSGEMGTVNIENWFKDSREDRYIVSDDGLKLHAYYCKSPKDTHKYVIACHGYTGKAGDMGVYAMNFTDNGFCVLMPDARAHGESEGKVIGMGWPERFDILRWIDYIVEQDSEAQIVLYGISMGAATVLNTTGEKLPDNVKAAIEDCGYSSVSGLMRSMSHMPNFPLIYGVSLVNQISGGESLIKENVTDQVKKSSTPTLFIHGTDDWLVPFDMLDELYNAAECEKQRLEVKGASHAGSSSTEPELYWSTVFNFVSNYID